MISKTLRSMVRSGLFWFSVISLMISANSGMAGISLGPKISDDPAEAEQRRITQFYEAQKSNQEKLRVGQKRFDQKQENRTKLLSAMAAELAARQESITMESMPVTYTETTQPHPWGGTVVGVGFIGIAFFGFRYYLRRLDAKNPVSR